MKMKKVLAAALCTTLVMGTSLSALAADTSVDAPIYSFEVLDVVVPTKYEVAFNPEGLQVKTGDSTTSTDQILSRNYGMINKGNKDQIMTVTLTVADQNTGEKKVTFVDSAQGVADAADGEYKIHLTVIPADSTEVKVGSTPDSADGNTAPADLNNVTMTKATDDKAVTLAAGENKVGFKLDKATYNLISGKEVTLGTSNTNNVASNYELTSLAAAGKGITAFTFGGTMNAHADWTKLTSGIKITVVYSNEVAPSDATVITGTGAMVKLGPSMSVSDTGLITITGLTADKNYKSMTITVSGSTYDIGEGTVDWDESQWNETDGGTLKAQLGEDWLGELRGTNGDKVTVTFTDDTTAEVVVSIPNN